MIKDAVRSILWSYPYEFRPIKSILWSFPYELRRLIFKAIQYRRYHQFKILREVETSSGYSFKPFIEHRCIFVHIPKCAGVSLGRSLFGNLGGGHTNIENYMIAFSKHEFESYFKFTFVRNPWDRLVSAYQFLKDGGMNDSDRLWAKKNLSSYIDFEDFVHRWVNRKNIETQVHFVPQYKFICRPWSNRPNVDFIGFYENIEEDVSYIQERLGINASLVETNKTRGKKRDYKEYYTDRTKAIIGEVYREDIEIFGYNFDNSSLNATQLRNRRKNAS